MKILLDENIDVRFKRLFLGSPHEVYTVRDMEWTGIKNGELLQLIKDNNFNCWVVVDKNIPHQQNVSKLPCTVIVLNVFRNTLEHITLLIPELLAVLNDPSETKVLIIPSDKRTVKD
ncbi:MAG: DUF5615 family PIN-like protein [Cyclobacteriaceae bacterium]|nr:DUF5615 family PIN-like protein [Cyclobacteriaceae bacterium]